ncbi:DUF6584 family protein [Actinoplanes sp. NPDC023801]|uniref:DUF6584 family protein n=1 Tax=Actinoplanes sp. NPDC023801 TaxID=3154595 RepID=UPI0033F4671D
MAKSETLAKVDLDLQRGHTHLAAQRLHSLIAADRLDLSLRARLAAVHRRTGNLAEAGRWGYLTEEATPAELMAFAKAHRRSAGDQLRALLLHGESPRPLGPVAEARLAELIRRAGTPQVRPTPAPARRAPGPDPALSPAPRIEPYQPPADMGRGEVIGGLLLMVFAAIGVISVIVWFL